MIQLEKFIQKKDLNELEEQGLIKTFDYSYELSWKTLQDLLKEKGYNNIVGPRPVIEQGFQYGNIQDGKAWMRKHKRRNVTNTTKEQKTSKKLADKHQRK